MANQEHLDILKQGVQAWNEWRKEYPDLIHPDLSEANLSEADLKGASLKGANLKDSNLSKAYLKGVSLIDATLSGADLVDAILIGAKLRSADLRGADLSFAYLMEADLREANLSGTTLYGAYFREANLTKANLEGANLTLTNLVQADLSFTNLMQANLFLANLTLANLSEANLSEASLKGATLHRTILSRTVFNRTILAWTNLGDIDLSTVLGLDFVDHKGFSSIGIDTIYRSKGNIPEAFLKGAGVDDTFIGNIRSLVGKPIEYYSCFISYSSKDQAFAKRLYSDLQSHNVRCWFAPEDLKWGGGIRTEIDEAIYFHDRLLLILSKHSVTSGWVEREVRAALTREKKEKQTVLFPVRVDRAVFDSPFDWATEIRHERNIGDFTRWKDHEAYQKAFSRLLRDLKAEAQKMETRDGTLNGGKS